MGDKSSIQWTDATFNPWRGCTKVSPGCTFCYADRQSRRNPKVLGIWGQKGTRVFASEAKWTEPLKWNRQVESGERGLTRVFCASLADIFEDWDGQMSDSRGRLLVKEAGIPPALARPFWEPPERGDPPYTLNDARERLWHLIRKTPALTWQILTKRPENIARMTPCGEWPNVWLGVSVENAEYLWRVDVLADVPQTFPVRFLSLEPLLGPLPTLKSVLGGIQWVIVGGESGGEARSMDVQWVRDIVRQCRQAKVMCFVKQLGRSPFETDEGTGRRYQLRMIHDGGHGGDMRDFPHSVRVREFP